MLPSGVGSKHPNCSKRIIYFGWWELWWFPALCAILIVHPTHWLTIQERLRRPLNSDLEPFPCTFGTLSGHFNLRLSVSPQLPNLARHHVLLVFILPALQLDIYLHEKAVTSVGSFLLTISWGYKKLLLHNLEMVASYILYFFFFS